MADAVFFFPEKYTYLYFCLKVMLFRFCWNPVIHNILIEIIKPWLKYIPDPNVNVYMEHN